MVALSPRFAMATPSYRGDLARCELLCASIDAFVSDLACHYLMVEDRDAPLFAHLAGPKRVILPESRLLPGWLAPWSDPIQRGRRLWTGPGALLRGVRPLRGWHVQQLRKLALARHIDEDIILFSDSDVVFLKPFALAGLMHGDRARLYRKPGGIGAGMHEHARWAAHAARLLGLAAPVFPQDDYINNLITWRADHARALLDHIEQRAGGDWVPAVARGGAFSEWLIYGLFVDQVLGEQGLHRATEKPLARTFWGAQDVGGGTLPSLDTLLRDDEVAIGVQSFIGWPLERLNALFAEAAARHR